MNDKIDLAAFLPYRFAKLSQQLSDGFAEVYRDEFGLTIPQWRVIAHLAEHKELTAKRLGDMANLDKSTASRAIAQLEEKQLLEKTVSPNDKRASILFLSEQGWQLYRALAPKALAWETKLLEAFSESEKQLLYKVLNKLTQ